MQVFFFLSFICETSRFIASYAILSICCPIVVIGTIASEAIGESSNPTIQIFVWETTVFTHEKVEENVGMSIVCHKDSFSHVGIFFFDN